MMPRMRFTLSDTSNEEIEQFIDARLKEFNDRTCAHFHKARVAGRKPLTIVVHDEKGRIVAGLVGSTYWNWLDIKRLWVTEDLRRSGLGRELMNEAEAEARKRGCINVKLSTFSFQARGFYEKLGYKVIGELSDYPPGESFFWMRKDR